MLQCSSPLVAPLVPSPLSPQYCCYLNTKSATTSFVKITNDAAVTPLLAQSADFSVDMNNNVDHLYRLRLEIVGSEITCGMDDGESANALIAEVTATDSTYASGGVAIVLPDSRSGHHFQALDIEAAVAEPTLQPVIPPTPLPVPSPSMAPTSTFAPTFSLQPTAALVSAPLTFCGSSVPSVLRVTQGTADFGQTNGDETCLATPLTGNPANRIETLGVDVAGATWLDPHVSLTFFQERYSRDVKVCGRTLTASTDATLDGMLDTNLGVSMKKRGGE